MLHRILRKKDDFKYIYAEKANTRGLEKLAELELKMYNHECHTCHDKREHLNNYNKYKEHDENIARYEKMIDLETGNISKLFINILKVLCALDYIDENNKLTDKGYMLTEIHSENDLLVAESISKGIFDDVEPAVLACLLSACIYSGRKNSSKRMPRKYSKYFNESHEKLLSLYKKIDRLQRKNKLSEIHDLDFGLVESLYSWCNGAELSQILSIADMEAGDFVRWCKQVKDLLAQIENIGVQNIALNALVARKAINRSVVAWSSI